MKKTLIILTIILCYSCKDESKNKEIQRVETPKTEVVKDGVLKIILNVKVKEDDKFELYYIDDSPEGTYSVDKRLAIYTKAADDFQAIEFKLPKEAFPYNFRIDLGDNENRFESDVEIKSINLILNENIIEIDNTLIDSFFQPNVYLQKTENGYSRNITEGKYDPFLTARPLLIKKMELEL